MKKAIRRRGVPQEILSQLQLPLSELIRQTLLDTVITSGTIQAIEMLRSQHEALCGRAKRKLQIARPIAMARLPGRWLWVDVG